MADIGNRIEKIKPYFKGMQVQEVGNDNIIYIMVIFPNKWVVSKDVEEKFGISVAKDNETYYFCAEMAVGFEKIFDAIDYTIEKMTTAQERAKLLKEKILELQEIFMDETIPISRLKNYEFVYKAKPKTKKKEVKNEEENINEEDRQQES